MKSIEIYTTQTCGYCIMAKRLLGRKEVAYSEIDVTGKPELRAEMIQRARGRYTVPQIFVDGEYLGDCDEMYAMDADGRLDRILSA